MSHHYPVILIGQSIKCSKGVAIRDIMYALQKSKPKSPRLGRATSIGGREFPFGEPINPELTMVDEETTPWNRSQDLFDILLKCSEHMGTSRNNSPSPPKEELRVENAEVAVAAGARQGCKCSKIGCLKLYCECFARGLTCGKECICSGCENCRGNEKKIRLAQEMANFRKPGSFAGVKAYVPERRCTCKKSQCLKNYCECHNAGMKCSPSCMCTDCHNR